MERSTQLILVLLLLGLLAVVGGQTRLLRLRRALGLEQLLAGGFLRHFLVTQAIYGVNTVCHLVGSRPHATREGSRNNAVMAWLTLGAGWHNTHHAFPASARLDEHWWQVDMSGWVLLLLERLGLVSSVRGLPKT
jgi:stearoyl-CoA desaturase (delta-9 desaturase)